MFTKFTRSTVLLIPSSRSALANRAFESKGHGPNNFTVLLSPSGNLPATHYGLHGVERAVDVRVRTDFRFDGRLPSTWWSKTDITETQAKDVFSKIIESSKTTAKMTPAEHFNEVLAANNLKTIEI